MSFEMPAILVSTVMIVMTGIAVALGRRPSSAATPRTITITIEDSSGARARTVTRSNRSVEEVRRLLERMVAQPS